MLDAITPQSLVVFYNIDGVAQCNFSGIIYRLVDGLGRIVSTTETTPGNAANQSPIACDPVTFGFSIPNLPLGTYSFDYLTAANASNQALSQVCLAPVAHGGFPVIENLTSAAAQASCL